MNIPLWNKSMTWCSGTGCFSLVTFMSVVSVFIIPRGLTLFFCSFSHLSFGFLILFLHYVSSKCVHVCVSDASQVFRMMRGGMQCHFSLCLSSVSPLLKVHSSLTHIHIGVDTVTHTWASQTSHLSSFSLHIQPFLPFCITPCLIFPCGSPTLFIQPYLAVGLYFLVLDMPYCSLLSYFCVSQGSNLWDAACLCPCYNIPDSKTNELKLKRVGEGRALCGAACKAAILKIWNLWLVIVRGWFVNL